MKKEANPTAEYYCRRGGEVHLWEHWYSIMMYGELKLLAINSLGNQAYFEIGKTTISQGAKTLPLTQDCARCPMFVPDNDRHRLRRDLGRMTETEKGKQLIKPPRRFRGVCLYQISQEQLTLLEQPKKSDGGIEPCNFEPQAREAVATSLIKDRVILSQWDHSLT